LISTSIPLLITSCINPSDSTVQLKDPQARLAHTLEALEQWFAIDPDMSIILCDGSNFDFGPAITKSFPSKKIEFLRFQNSSSSVQRLGKGFGEGEIVKHALTHSQILRKSTAFAKCTGKLWVGNFRECLDQWNGIFIGDAFFSNIFNTLNTKIQYIDTRFYIVDKNFYLLYLVDAYIFTSFEENNSLENIFLKKLMSLNMKSFIFSINPIIQGMGGGSGTYYKNNLKRKIKNNLKRFILKKYSQYRPLFHVIGAEKLE
jgi:hypothetical protein